jgi:hypothetical protein
LFFSCLSSVSWFPLPAAADELKTLTGKSVTGTLAAISDTDVTLKTDSGKVTTPLPQVLALDLQPSAETPAGPFVSVQLIDGTALHCKTVTYQARDVELSLVSGTPVKLPLSAVASVLQQGQEAKLAEQLDKFARQKVRRDRIFVVRGGDLQPLEGTLGDIDPAAQTIQFKREGAGAVALPLGRLQALLFHRTEVPAQDSICRVIQADGSNVVASKLGYDGSTLTVNTTFGTQIALKPATVARLDFNFGKLTYLSDLDAKVIPSPWLGGITSIRKDQNLDGSPITLDDRTYDKGLSLYAGTMLEYQLGGKYKEFKATIGVDPRIAEEGQGEVVLTVYCDGEKRLTEVVSTRAARPIALNVKDVQVLRIVAAGRDFTNLSGHATLADARVTQ